MIKQTIPCSDALNNEYYQIHKEKIQTILHEVKVKVAQLCLTLCHPRDFTVHEILQARIMEWVHVPFSRGSSQPRD